MDLLERLIQEHRDVEELLSTLSDADERERAELIEQLDAALTRHMTVEEQHVYPLVERSVSPEAEAEAESEHELTREGLAKLRAMQDKPGFGAAVDMLAAGIRHHVEEEEQEVFPELRKKAAKELDGVEDGATTDREGAGSARRSDDSSSANGNNANGTSGTSGNGSDEPTKEELYQQAKDAGIEGRSTMTKRELEEALREQR